MKCSDCGNEIIGFSESKGYCRECESSFIEKFVADLRIMSSEEKLDHLAKVSTEMISRNMMDKL